MLPSSFLCRLFGPCVYSWFTCMRVYLIGDFKRQRSFTVNKIIQTVVTAQSDTHGAQRRSVWIFRPVEYLGWI